MHTQFDILYFCNFNYVSMFVIFVMFLCRTFAFVFIDWKRALGRK